MNFEEDIESPKMRVMHPSTVAKELEASPITQRKTLTFDELADLFATLRGLFIDPKKQSDLIRKIISGLEKRSKS